MPSFGQNAWDIVFGALAQLGDFSLTRIGKSRGHGMKTRALLDAEDACSAQAWLTYSNVVLNCMCTESDCGN
jgi:hypothetical protein